MLDFFHYNEISPKEIYGPTERTMEQSSTKRINVLIAILRNNKKTQTKPTVEMLTTLFEMEEPKKKSLILEKKTFKELGSNFINGSK